MNYKEHKIFWVSIDLSLIIQNLTASFPPEQNVFLLRELNESVLQISAGLSMILQSTQKQFHTKWVEETKYQLARLHTAIILTHKKGYVNDNVLGQVENVIAEIGKLISNTKQETGSKKPEK